MACGHCKRKKPCRQCKLEHLKHKKNNPPLGPKEKEIPAPKLQYNYPEAYNIKQHKKVNRKMGSGKGRKTFMKMLSLHKARGGKMKRRHGGRSHGTKKKACVSVRGGKINFYKLKHKVGHAFNTVGKVAKTASEISKTVPLVGKLAKPVFNGISNLTKGHLGKVAASVGKFAPQLMAMGAGFRRGRKGGRGKKKGIVHNPFPGVNDIITAPLMKSGLKLHHEGDVHLPGEKVARLNSLRGHTRNTFLRPGAAPGGDSIWNVEQIPVHQAKMLLNAQSQGINTVGGHLNGGGMASGAGMSSGAGLATAGALLTGGCGFRRRRRYHGGCGMY